jgi:hypothetical protein
MDGMQSKTNLDYFNNKRKVLKYDWHGVRCRSQEEVEKGLDILTAKEEEEVHHIASGS